MTEPRGKKIVRFTLSLAMIAIGVLHFVKPEGFVSIVPSWVPAPETMVYVSGVAEIAGGLGLHAPWPWLRRVTSYALIALYIAVFPANLNQAMNAIPVNGKAVPPLLLWGRLPLQLLLIWLAWWCTARPREQATRR